MLHAALEDAYVLIDGSLSMGRSQYVLIWCTSLICDTSFVLAHDMQPLLVGATTAGFCSECLGAA
jgi:hypothetical protein